MERPVTPKEIELMLAVWKNSQRRPAWKPTVSDGAGDPSGSRFGGPAYSASGPELCGICRAPMPLLIQLDLESTPGGIGRGLLQAFYCADADCEQTGDGWSPFSQMHRVRMVDKSGGALTPTPNDHPARAIVGWEPLQDLPSAQDHDELGLELQYDFVQKTVAIRCPSVGLDAPPIGIDDLTAEQIADAETGDKLLGWPHWVQGAEYPSCPECKSRMRYLFQIDSEDHLPIMWGDVGIAHLSQCPNHPHVLTLGWACG
jgi:hypothetical protein